MNSKKRKERREIITLAVVCAVILVLIIVYFVVAKVVNGDPEETTGPSEPGPGQDGVFAITEEDFTLMTKLSYTVNGGTVSLHADALGRWALDDDEKFPVDQEKVVMMAQAISDFGGHRRYLYDGSLASDYGTDVPKLEITATYYNDTSLSTAHERHLILGSKETLNGNYYFYEPGSSYIYTVEDLLSQYFSYSKSDLFMVEPTPSPEPEDIVSLNFEYDGGSFAYSEGDDGLIETANAVMENVPKQNSLRFYDAAAYGLDASEKSEFGFDEPSAVFDLIYKEHRSAASEGSSSAVLTKEVKFSMYFGSRVTEEEDGKEVEYVYMYYMTDEEYTGTVYKVRAYKFDALVNAASGSDT